MMSKEGLNKEAESIFSITNKDSEQIWKTTIAQQACAKWKEQWKGQITASNS